MTNLSLKPSGAIFEIEIPGSFIPSNYTPMWFFFNELLGKEEAEQTTILKADKENLMAFTTKFIRVVVEKNSFKIGAAQLLSFDLAKDMAINVCKLIKDSISNEFSIDVSLHVSLKNGKEFRRVLNSIGNAERWNGLLSKPQSLELEVHDEIDFQDKKLERILQINPCGRSDMPNTVHLNVFNIFTLKEPKSTVWQTIEKDTTTLNDSILLINKLTNLHFKK